jgi:hypothetical protein
VNFLHKGVAKLCAKRDKPLCGGGDFFPDEIADNFTRRFVVSFGSGAKIRGGNIVYDNDMVLMLHKETIFPIP